MSNNLVNFKHVKRFEEFIELLKGKFPKDQIDFIEYYPDFNPRLNIGPQDWWIECFDWFIVIDLIPGQQYGPFYRIGSKYFWPEIGKPEKRYSEKMCFYQLKSPVNSTIEELNNLYNFLEYNPDPPAYVYEFTISKEYSSPGALFFSGPVKGGRGFQVNPNKTTVDIIRATILDKEVKRYRIKKGIVTDESEEYVFSIDQIVLR